MKRKGNSQVAAPDISGSHSTLFQGEGNHSSAETRAAMLRELVAHLRQNRTQLREEWAQRITDAQLLTAMSQEEKARVVRGVIGHGAFAIIT